MDYSIFLYYNKFVMIRKYSFNKIYIIHNLFDPNELHTITNNLQKCQWTKDDNGNSGINLETTISQSEECINIYNLYNQKVNLLKNEIKKDFICDISEENHNTIVEYHKGWSLHAHVDSWSNLTTYAGYPSRDISSLIYLTDDFKGGNLIFNNLNIEIEPVAGSAIYFPSDEEHMHQVSELLSGTRWVSTCFWHVL
jgi:hypothetical protein